MWRMSQISKWKYIKIELEILGKVTDVRFVQQKDYQRVLNLFIAYGKTQPHEWAVFIKRHYHNRTIYQRMLRKKNNIGRRRKPYELNKK